ncbi:hypothetical protein OAB57_00800 [Bacteriovoracaceae bacterium]|nr:hypothetical protein [Bacteriovoracaceae bacterium]
MNRSVLCLAFILVGCSNVSLDSSKKVIPEDSMWKKPKIGLNYRSKKVLDTKESRRFFVESLDAVSISEVGVDERRDKLVKISLLCSEKRYSEAKLYSQKMTSSYLSDPNFWNEIGICYLKQDLPKLALLYLNKSLELNPRYFPSINNIGIIFIKMGNYQKALNAFKKASRIGQFATTPKYNLAVLYVKFGILDKAKMILSSIPGDIDFKRSSDRVKMFFTEYYHKIGNVKQAKDLFNSIENPDKLFVRRMKGRY